jgi:hypothetical protein
MFLVEGSEDRNSRCYWTFRAPYENFIPDFFYQTNELLGGHLLEAFSNLKINNCFWIYSNSKTDSPISHHEGIETLRLNAISILYEIGECKQPFI